MSGNALIQLRRDTAANWTGANPTLASGEVGFETDTGKLKVGTGAAAWAALSYFSPGGGGGAGTVTSVSVTTAAGVSGSVANPTTTPAITVTLGAITPTSVAASGAVTGSNLSGTNTGDQTSVSGNAGTATALATPRAINGVNFDGTAAITINAVDAIARVPATRSVLTTAPLAGGGNLGADLTLTIAAASGSVPGSMSAADFSKLAAISGTNTGDQTITLTGNVTGSGTGSFATTIGSGVVTLAMQANMATASVVYRKTAGSGAPEVNTLATLKTDLGLTGTNSGDQTVTLTSDVTGSGTGSFATTIAAGVVTLAKMASVATATVFYRKTAGSGDPEVQTLATLKSDLGLTGTNSGDQTITLTGDAAGSGTGSFATTLATVNSNVGSFGSGSLIPVVTVNGKGLVTAVTTTAVSSSGISLGLAIATRMGAFV